VARHLTDVSFKEQHQSLSEICARMCVRARSNINLAT